MKRLSLHLWFDLEAVTYLDNLLPLELKWETFYFPVQNVPSLLYLCKVLLGS